MGQQKQFYDSAKGQEAHKNTRAPRGSNICVCMNRLCGKKQFYESVKGLRGPLEVSCGPMWQEAILRERQGARGTATTADSHYGFL